MNSPKHAHPLIILDRDGVINQDSDAYVKSPDEWIPIPGSLEAIAKLNTAGYKVAVATNQSGIARGYFSIDVLEAMHQKMNALLVSLGGQVDFVAYCPHGPDDHCECRKPKAGLLQIISTNLGIPLGPEVYMVGDSIKDLEAGIKMNCTPVLVKTGKGLKSFEKLKATSDSSLKAVKVYTSLSEFVDTLIRNNALDTNSSGSVF